MGVRRALTWAAIVVVVGMFALTGCSSAESPAGSESTSPQRSRVSTGSTDASASTISTGQAASVLRPSEEAIAKAIIGFAKHESAKVPVEGVEVVSLGNQGDLWWVQAFNKSPPPWESEQWFATWDGTRWRLRDYGTGMSQADYPSDIIWERPDR
jgi:hypothetical protein